MHKGGEKLENAGLHVRAACLEPYRKRTWLPSSGFSGMYPGNGTSYLPSTGYCHSRLAFAATKWYERPSHRGCWVALFDQFWLAHHLTSHSSKSQTAKVLACRDTLGHPVRRVPTL